LEALTRHGVDFVVVGGVAAILEGTPITTLDLDVVYDAEVGNVERLATALTSIGARYRDPAGRSIRPTGARLRANRVNLLETALGLCDAMQEIGAGWRYQDVAARAHRRRVGDLGIAVLDLAAVIESKEAAGRAKDAAMLPVLRETLRLRAGQEP
jgi:hypothetical protein